MDNQTQMDLYLHTKSDIKSLTIGNKKIDNYMLRVSRKENHPGVVQGTCLTRKYA